jgi:hypothetical protein
MARPRSTQPCEVWQRRCCAVKPRRRQRPPRSHAALVVLAALLAALAAADTLADFHAARPALGRTLFVPGPGSPFAHGAARVPGHVASFLTVREILRERRPAAAAPSGDHPRFARGRGDKGLGSVTAGVQKRLRRKDLKKNAGKDADSPPPPQDADTDTATATTAGTAAFEPWMSKRAAGLQRVGAVDRKNALGQVPARAPASAQRPAARARPPPRLAPIATLRLH